MYLLLLPPLEMSQYKFPPLDNSWNSSRLLQDGCHCENWVSKKWI